LIAAKNKKSIVDKQVKAQKKILKIKAKQAKKAAEIKSLIAALKKAKKQLLNEKDEVARQELQQKIAKMKKRIVAAKIKLAASKAHEKEVKRIAKIRAHCATKQLKLKNKIDNLHQAVRAKKAAMDIATPAEKAKLAKQLEALTKKLAVAQKKLKIQKKKGAAKVDKVKFQAATKAAQMVINNKIASLNKKLEKLKASLATATAEEKQQIQDDIEAIKKKIVAKKALQEKLNQISKPKAAGDKKGKCSVEQLQAQKEVFAAMGEDFKKSKSAIKIIEKRIAKCKKAGKKSKKSGKKSKKAGNKTKKAGSKKSKKTPAAKKADSKKAKAEVRAKIQKVDHKIKSLHAELKKKQEALELATGAEAKKLKARLPS